MSDDYTTHQIDGVCDGVMMKGDWQEFHINVGRQYPVKLSTKQEDVQAAAAAAGTQKAVWTYTEREGAPNPHRPGENFKNRYLSNVEVGGTLDPSISSGQQTLPSTQAAPIIQSSGRSTTTDRSIERQVIVKSAMYLYPTALITTDEQWFALIHKIDAFMQKPAATTPAVAKAKTETAPPDESQAAVAQPDDDIPF